MKRTKKKKYAEPEVDENLEAEAIEPAKLLDEPEKADTDEEDEERQKGK